MYRGMGIIARLLRFHMGLQIKIYLKQTAKAKTWLCASCLLLRRWVLTPDCWVKTEKERGHERSRGLLPQLVNGLDWHS